MLIFFNLHSPLMNTPLVTVAMLFRTTTATCTIWMSPLDSRWSHTEPTSGHSRPWHRTLAMPSSTWDTIMVELATRAKVMYTFALRTNEYNLDYSVMKPHRVLAGYSKCQGTGILSTRGWVFYSRIPHPLAFAKSEIISIYYLWLNN